jgi:DNA-binding GntR family transcriptional regulator
MHKIERKKLSNQVYDILKEMIANHRFKPGARLNVEQITKELGVSRTPVWEAVSRLEQEDLVENIPNRGVFMAVLTPQKALELYAVREVLEGMAARLAAERVDAKSLELMESCLAHQKQVVESGDLNEYSKSDFRFHAIIYELSGNAYLQEMLETIKNKMRPIKLSIHVDPVLPHLYEQHLKLFEALRTGDAEKAESVFREHNQYMIALISKEAEAGRWHQLGIAGNG